MSDVKAIRFFVEKSVLDIGVKIVFLILHLVGMTSLLDEDQLVLFCRWHMFVQVAKELGRISICEVVIGSHQQCACDE